MSADAQPGDRMPSIPACAALFAGGLVLAFHAGGMIPFLSPDTVNDEKFIRSCCSFAGMGTSVPGIVMGANWWHFKTLWAFLGFSDGSLHVLMHVSLAAAIVMIVNIGARLRSQWAGYIAVAVMLVMLWTSFDFRMDMNYNHRGFPFLGALFVALSMAAVETGRLRYLIMAAFTAAITANIHLQASVLFFSVGLVALMMARVRFQALLVGVGTFALTAFLTSPTAWMDNLQVIFFGTVGGGGGSGERVFQPQNLQSYHYLAIATAILAMLALVVANLRDRDHRRWPLLLLAVLVPRFVIFSGAVAFGVTGSSDKYLVDAEPAIGLALGLAVVVAVQYVWKSGARFVRVRKVAPYLAAVALAVWPAPSGVGRGLDGFPMLQASDIDALHDYLVTDSGWNISKVAQGLKGPSNLEIIDYMCVTHPQKWETPSPVDGTQVTVLKLDDERSPDPVPSNWQLIRRDGDSTLWVVWSETWLDWGSFQVCIGPWGAIPDGLQCVESGIGTKPWNNADESVALVGFPQPAMDMDLRLRIRFNVRYPDGGSVHRLFMPDIPDRCSGRVVAVTGGESELLEGGRAALLKGGSGGGGEGTITLQWHVGGEGCRGWSYRAFVPSFVEGMPETVRAIEETVRAYWPHQIEGR